MQPLSVVIAQVNPIEAERLAIALHPHFRDVSIARDMEELRRNTVRNRAALVVLDLDLVTIEELAAFCEEFANVSVVCTHRIADEEMWMQILNAGAVDCCPTLDIRLIVETARSNAKKAAAGTD